MRRFVICRPSPYGWVFWTGGLHSLGETSALIMKFGFDRSVARVFDDEGEAERLLMLVDPLGVWRIEEIADVRDRSRHGR